ncbi:hypothetical protein [Silvimonas amylolytica]|nr:hypothetical protein [Silvimonas amylolytica]
MGVLVGFVVVGMMIHRQVVVPAIQDYELRSALKENRLFSAFQQYYPVEFESFTTHLKKAYTSGESIDAARAEAFTAGQALALKHASAASDDAIVQLFRTQIEVARELGKTAPGICFASITGKLPNSADFQKAQAAIMDSNNPLKAKAEDAMIDVLRSSATDPQKPGTREQVIATVTPLVQAMAQKYGNKLRILQGVSPSSVGVDDATACDIMADFYGRVTTLAPEKAGTVLRGMSAMAGR